MLYPYLLAMAGAWIGFANPFFRLPGLVLLLPLGLSLTAMKADTLRQAFKHGFFAGTLAYGGCLYWIAVPIYEYGGLPFIAAAPCPVLVAMYVALFTGLFCLGLRYGIRRLSPLSAGLLAGALWAGLEILRNVFLTGFPWVPLASALAPWPWAIQGVSILGAYAFSGVLATATAWLAMGEGFRLGRERIAAILLLALAAGYGLYRVETPLAPGLADEGTATISMVQGNIDQGQKWDAAFLRGTIDRYLTLSAGEIAEHHPDLVIWPETAMPFFLQDGSPESIEVRGFAAEHKTAILTGAPGYVAKPGGRTYEYYNRAYLIDQSGKIAGEYAKEHLVPFGEYVPLGDYLPIGKLVQAVGDFYPGRDPRPLRQGKLAAGLLVCYETIFPELAQARVENGANVLVNISNDAWFGRSSAPRQHLDMSVLRAVEQGRWLVRATNTGISTVIDPKGRLLFTSGLYKTTSLFTGGVSLVSGATPFHRGYDYINPGILAACVLLLGRAALSGRRVRSEREETAGVPE